mgnify:CR=1 FL=1
MSRKHATYFRIGLVISLTLSLVTIIVISLAVGSVAISSQDFQGIIREGFENNFSSLSGSAMILWKIRLPRILMVGLIGAILSVLGLLMQTISRNPLADPYVLGISSGASTGAVAAIVFGWLSFLGSYQIFYSSLLGSILITVLLFVLMGGSQDPLKLILIGAGISAFFSALTTLIVFSAQNEAQVRSAMFWLVGSFSGVQWGDLYSVAISLLVLLCGSYLFQKELNLMYVGLKEAKQLGVNLKVFFISLILISSGAAAISVSKVGVIGFVGLIIPHIMRRLIGVDHRWLIGGSALLGANLLILADSFARTYFRPEEVPVGILTAFIGAPIFIHIVMGLYSEEAGE